MVKVALRAVGAPVDVHHALASGAPFESVLRLARERAERADAPTVPAPPTVPTLRCVAPRVVGVRGLVVRALVRLAAAVAA